MRDRRHLLQYSMPMRILQTIVALQYNWHCGGNYIPGYTELSLSPGLVASMTVQEILKNTGYTILYFRCSCRCSAPFPLSRSRPWLQCSYLQVGSMTCQKAQGPPLFFPP